MKYKSIFISDLHLGTKHSKADNLYLVGDIIDGWAIRQKFRWKQSHSDMIQKILRVARKGTNVYYITGNHDEFLCSFLPLLLGENLKIVNDIDYLAVDGNKYFVTHGDMFDNMILAKKWLTIFGDIGYDFLLNLNPIVNNLRQSRRLKIGEPLKANYYKPPKCGNSI